MTYVELKALFRKHEKQYCKFSKIKNPPFPAPDMCAFVKLLEMFPEHKGDVVAGVVDDDFILFPDLDEDEENFDRFNDENVLYLQRCGVAYDEIDGYLYMVPMRAKN